MFCGATNERWASGRFAPCFQRERYGHGEQRLQILSSGGPFFRGHRSPAKLDLLSSPMYVDPCRGDWGEPEWSGGQDGRLPGQNQQRGARKPNVVLRHQ